MRLPHTPGRHGEAVAGALADPVGASLGFGPYTPSSTLTPGNRGRGGVVRVRARRSVPLCVQVPVPAIPRGCLSPQFYRPLNIRVVLVGVEVWSDVDKCPIGQDPFASLHEFLDWRKAKLLPRKSHDNAQLVRWVGEVPPPAPPFPRGRSALMGAEAPPTRIWGLL